MWKRGTTVLAAFALGACAFGCSAIVHPDTRLLNEDSGTVGEVDSGNVPGDDAAVVDRDAWQQPGCPTTCTDGTICDGTQCICPFGSCCPACALDQLCVAANCVACGNAGESCCEGGACNGGATCLAGTCLSCGDPGNVCCEGGACNPGAICNGATCDVCGTAGQPCCEGGACDGGASCGSDGLCHGSTTSCGDQGQPCCVGGTCNDGALVCNGGFPLGGGTCEPCGGTSERCCTGGVCDSGNACGTTSNTCNPCGQSGQRCCSGRVCRGGSTCRTSGYCG